MKLWTRGLVLARVKGSQQAPRALPISSPRAVSCLRILSDAGCDVFDVFLSPFGSNVFMWGVVVCLLV